MHGCSSFTGLLIHTQTQMFSKKCPQFAGRVIILVLLVCSDYRLQMRARTRARIQPNLRKGRGCPHVGGALWDWRMFGLKPPLALRVHVTEAVDLFGQKKNTLYSSFSSQTQSWVQTRETRVPGASPCTKMSSKGHWRILWLFPNHLWLVRHSGRRQIPDLMRKGLFHLPTGV